MCCYFTELRPFLTRYCSVCDENVLRTSYVGHLRSRRHCTRAGFEPLGDGVVALQSAFKSRIVSYKVTSENVHINVIEFLNEIKEKIMSLLERQISKFNSVKVNFELFGYFILETKDLEDIKSFNTANEVVTFGTDLNQLYDQFSTILDEKASEFQERESGTSILRRFLSSVLIFTFSFAGWALKQLLYLHVNVNKYNPLRASSYFPLPKQIQNKKAVVNVQNDDEFCFGWAVVSAICEPTGPCNRTSSYVDFRQLLNFRDIEFPVKLSDVSKFEKYNPQISINVYGLEEILEGAATREP